MQITGHQLRTLIREEIGRNLRSGERLDHYPWITDDIKVQIYPDGVTDKWWAVVEPEEGEPLRVSRPTQEEATIWARLEWEKIRRKKFSGSKQSV